MDTVLRIVGYLLLGLSIAGLVVAVRVLRREVPVRTKFDVIRLGISLGSALLITVVLSVDTPPVLVGAALVAGAAVGFLQGQGMNVRFDGDQVFARRSVLAILAWGSGMIVAQGAGLLNRAGTVSVGLAVAYFSAAMVGGTMLGRNQAIAKARIATASAAAAMTVLFLLVAPFVPGGSGPAAAQTASSRVEMSGTATETRGGSDDPQSVTNSFFGLSFDFAVSNGEPVVEGLAGSFSATVAITTDECDFTVGHAATFEPANATSDGDVVTLSGSMDMVVDARATEPCGDAEPETVPFTYSLSWLPTEGTFTGILDGAGDTRQFTVEGTTNPVTLEEATDNQGTRAEPNPPVAAQEGTFTVTAAMDVPASFSQLEEGLELDEETVKALGFLGTKENRIAFEIPEDGGPVAGEIEIVHEVDFVLLGQVIGAAFEDAFADEEPSLEEILAQVGIDPALVGRCTFDITQTGALTGTFDPASGSLEGTATVTSSFEEVRFEDVSDECIAALEEQSDEPLTPEEFDEGPGETEEQTGTFTATLTEGEITGTITLDDSSLIVFAPAPESEDDVAAGSAAGASLVGLVGVAGMLGSTMTETGMSTAELTGAMRREGLSGLDRLSPATDPPPPPPPDLEAPTTTPQGAPEGVEATPSGSSPTPAAPDSGVPQPAVTEPDPAPDTRAFKATADVSSDVTGEAPAPPAPDESTPSPPTGSSVDVSPDVTADEAPAPAEAGPDAAASAPGAPAVEPAPDVVDFSDALPGGAGPREAINSVAGSLSEPAAFEAVDIDPQEAVDRLRTAGVGLRDNLNPVSRLSEDVAAAIRENPVAGARGLVGADALDRIVDLDVPVGQGGGSDLFGAADVVVSPEAAGGAGGTGILAGIDLDASGAETIADSSAFDTPDAGGASANAELLGDIGEDGSELMSDVVEDRALADRRHPTGPPAGPNWAFRRLEASAAARLGLPPVALPVRAANADTIFGDPVATDRLLGELDDYLAAHPDQADAYGPVVAELAYVVGVETGSTGSYGEAASHLRVGLQYAPANLSLLTHYALALQCLGDHAQAARIYERLEQDPRMSDNALVTILAARAHADAGEHDNARTVLGELAEDPVIRSLVDRLDPNAGDSQ